jgi:hypothetical protein
MNPLPPLSPLSPLVDLTDLFSDSAVIEDDFLSDKNEIVWLYTAMAGMVPPLAHKQIRQTNPADLVTPAIMWPPINQLSLTTRMVHKDKRIWCEKLGVLHDYVLYNGCLPKGPSLWRNAYIGAWYRKQCDARRDNALHQYQDAALQMVEKLVES